MLTSSTRPQDALIAGLVAPSVHTLGLSICCSGLQVPFVQTTDSSDSDLSAFIVPCPPCTAEDDLATLDLNALAGRLQAAAPSLRTVVVTLVGHLTLVGHRTRAGATVVRGATAVRALGANAVEAIPLKVAKMLRETWGRELTLFHMIQKVEVKLSQQRLTDVDAEGHDSAVDSGPV